MFELRGKHATARVYSSGYDDKAIGQIINLCNQDFVQGSQIRIMPDYHYGAGCTIGFTANLGDKVIPNLVGVDIGCGMFTVNLGDVDVNFEKVDQVIRNYIPSGFESRKNKLGYFNKLNNLNCLKHIKGVSFYELQLGTLGGGNHFIELAEDKAMREIYLIIHSGSRNLGKTVADYYQNLAIDYCHKELTGVNVDRKTLIEQLKKEGRQDEIQKELKKFDAKVSTTKENYPKDLCYLEGELKEQYLQDMLICQEYASMNRKIMAHLILTKVFDSNYVDSFETIHNYISPKDNIIRKGAISAYKGEKVIIPINMRDGSIIAIGRGNPDWNFSAPHGAGRLMSRSEAKNKISLQEFQETMEGVYSTTVKQSTLDEAPQAYKSMDEILENIEDTVDIYAIIRPLYNYKAN